MMSGGFSLGAGGIPVQVGKPQGFNFLPGLGAVPIGLNLGTNFELAELKVQWLLLDFGRRLGRLRAGQAVVGHRRAPDRARLPDRGQRGRSGLLQRPQEPGPAANGPGRPPSHRGGAGGCPQTCSARASSSARSSCEPRCKRAEYRQEFHAATEAEFVALAGLNLAIGLKCNQPLRVVEPTDVPPLTTSLADCLQTAIQQRREFYVVQRTVEIATARGRVARASSHPKSSRTGPCWTCSSSRLNGHVDLRLGFIRLEWALFDGGRRIAATRVADSQVRQAMAQAESIADQIAFQVNEAYRNAVTAWVGIDDARPAVDQASENYRLVQLRLREGAATPTEIADAQASLTRAEQNYLNARYNYLIAMDRLEYAMGVGQTPMIQAPKHH